VRGGLGHVGEAELVEPRTPTTAYEVESLSWGDLNVVFALWSKAVANGPRTTSV